jgi:hypothetical protein
VGTPPFYLPFLYVCIFCVAFFPKCLYDLPVLLAFCRGDELFGQLDVVDAQVLGYCSRLRSRWGSRSKGGCPIVSGKLWVE